LSPRVQPERFDAAGLRAALDERLEGLYGSAAPLEKALLAQDPTGETLEIVRRLAPARAPRSIDGVWFDASGQRALLIAETAAPASDIDGQAAALDALTRIHAEVAPQSALAYTSPGALAVESRSVIAREARVLSVVSAVLIAGVLALTYRAVVPVALCAVPAAFGLLAGVCAVHAGLGRLNGITLAFAATLLGEAVDYPSFLFTQVAPGETPAAARARVGGVLRLAVLTTACGALALLTSGFPGLVELGTLTMVGILAAGAVTWWVLPDWAPADLGRSLPALREGLPLRMPLSPRVRWILVLVALAVLVAIDRARAWFDDDLAHLNPLPVQYAAHDRALRDALGAPDVRSLVMIRGRDEQNVLERAEQLRPVLEAAVAAKEAEGFDLASDYLPSRATQLRRLAALPARDALHASLAAAVAGTPFRVDAFAPFEHDVEAARNAAPLRADDLAGTALGLRVAALLGRDGDDIYAVVPLRGVRDGRALAGRVAALGDRHVAWLDLREESVSLLAAYRHQALVATVLGIAMIYVVLGAGLRDAYRAAAVLAPVIVATLLAAAVLVALGIALTLFHLVALLLVIGIGVNYALFADRAVREAGEGMRVVRTLLVVSGTTLCAFATLAFSTIPVLRALGTTVCAGVVACLLVIALTMLPAPQRTPAKVGQ
jgi:predicted exporter